MNYEIVPAQASHVPLLRERLRTLDHMDMTCIGVPIRRALWRSYRRSLIAKSAFLDGEIACMWGIEGRPLSESGEIWLMTASAVEKMPISFVRQARREVESLLEVFPKLQGYVSQSYANAVKFLRILGVSFGDMEPVGPNRVPLQRFTLER